MGKLSGDLYNATRTIGKLASTVNDVEHFKKSVEIGDFSKIANRVARKAITKASHEGADKMSKQIIQLFK